MNLKDRYQEAKILTEVAYDKKFKETIEKLKQTNLVLSTKKYTISLAYIGNEASEDITSNGVALMDKSPPIKNTQPFPIIDADISDFIDLCREVVKVLGST